VPWRRPRYCTRGEHWLNGESSLEDHLILQAKVSSGWLQCRMVPSQIHTAGHRTRDAPLSHAMEKWGTKDTHASARLL
jgi:hypothetical protein